jgi:hypothetical protein
VSSILRITVVEYSANYSSSGAMNPTGQPGAKEMARMVKDSMSKCPETKIVVSGYSQGAEQVHGALKILGTEAAKVGVSDSATSLLLRTY